MLQILSCLIVIVTTTSAIRVGDNGGYVRGAKHEQGILFTNPGPADDNVDADAGDDDDDDDDEDSSIITMADLAKEHRRRTQAEDDIHIHLVYNNHPHEIYSYRHLQSSNANDTAPIQTHTQTQTETQPQPQPHTQPQTSALLSTPSNSSVQVASAIGTTINIITSTPSNAPSSIPTQTNIEPIRIVYETTELDLNNNPYEQKTIQAIKAKVLPEIAKIWSSILSVTPVMENIPIPINVCNGFFPNVPPEIVENGVENADLVIFVSGASYVNDKRLCGSKTLASASFCNLDQVDRPAIGFINFCLSNFDEKKMDKMVKIGVHEMAHILGWNDDLLKYFRNRETGEPFTSRPFKTESVPCVDGRFRDYELPAQNTLQMKKDWSTGVEAIYYEVVTPSLQQVTRNQFGCQTLTGARLENQPTKNSCIGAHFDERYFFTEVMGAIYSSASASALSPLTLALIEDTGFYEVHYYSPYVQNSAFGLGAGCDFLTDSCIEEETEKVKESFKPYFCDTVTKFTDNGIDQAADNTCDPSFSNIAYCDLIDFSDGPPAGYDAPDEDAYSYFSNKNLGVLFTHANYCPIPTILAVDCIEGPVSSYQKLYPGEEYGDDSRCINTKFKHPQDGYVNRGACFRTTCDQENQTLLVHVDGEDLFCEFDGQEIDFPWTATASFICPPLNSICPEMFCPGLCSAKGVCNYELDRPKCECFDENDTSEGCFGKDYHTYTSDRTEANKDPNSGRRNSLHLVLPTFVLFFVVCTIV